MSHLPPAIANNCIEFQPRGHWCRWRFVDFSREQIKHLKGLLAAHTGLIPSWCHCLTLQNAVRYGDNAQRATVSADQEYRIAAITVFQQFLDDPLDQQRDSIAHELCHLVLWPISEPGKDLIKQFVSEDMQSLALDAHR